MSYNKERYRTLKNIAYYILFAVWYVVSLLPMWFLHAVSSVVSVLLFHVVRYRRQVVHDNIKSSFPELSPRKRWMIERRFYTHFCDLMLYRRGFLNGPYGPAACPRAADSRPYDVQLRLFP